MPDIFNRNPEDYVFRRYIDEAGQLDAHERALQQRFGIGLRHDFDALGSGAPLELQRADEWSQSIGYLTNNLLAIQSMADEILYTRNRLRHLIPINSMIPEGAETYAVRVIDYVGEGDYITHDGTDAPNATASQRIEPWFVDEGGIDAKWTLSDLRNAMFTGFALETETLDAAMRGAMNHMERVALTGDAARGYSGLTNLPTTGRNAVTSAAALATFAASTGEAMRDAINDEINSLITDSDEVFGGVITSGLTIYLPTYQFGLASSRFVGDNEEVTVMAAVKRDNPWKHHVAQYGEGMGGDVMFKSVIELNDAAGANSDRMVTTLQDQRIFEMGVAIEPRVVRIMDQGRTMCAPIEYKFGPLFVKRPKQIRYLNGI